MRTDMMHLFSGGNEVQPRRMDCIGCRDSDGAGAGFAMGESCRSTKRPFRNVLADVAAGNVAAQRITAATMEKKAAGDASRSGKGTPAGNDGSHTPGVEEVGLPNTASGAMDVLSDEMFISHNDRIETENHLTDSNLLSVDKDAAASAEQIVRDSLAEISEVLGLSIFPGLENLSLDEISGDTQAQFAEIVFILKKMVQGFELGRATGMAIETPKATVEGTAIDTITDVLRTNAFRIEVACNVLGIAESVQKQVAVKLELYGSNGILQATDPATLTMASQHLDRLFGGLFTDTTPIAELALLIEKVKKLLAENSGASQVVAVDGRDESASAKIDVSQFETRVYRALLKIDKMDMVGQQNGEASLGGEKADPLKTAFSAVQAAKNLSADAGDGVENMMLPDNTSGLRQNVAGIEARISSTLFRMTDAAIMEQITGRLQTIIRSGLSEVRLQLRPESLGEVTMRIRMEGDVVAAKIEVQNQQVKEIMERNLPMLKDALAQQNLTAGSFDIQINGGSGRHPGAASQEPWNEQETAQGNLFQKEKEDENSSSDRQQQPGRETGRRFGSNSVEYFA